MVVLIHLKRRRHPLRHDARDSGLRVLDAQAMRADFDGPRKKS